MSWEVNHSFLQEEVQGRGSRMTIVLDVQRTPHGSIKQMCRCEHIWSLTWGLSQRSAGKDTFSGLTPVGSTHVGGGLSLLV